MKNIDRNSDQATGKQETVYGLLPFQFPQQNDTKYNLAQIKILDEMSKKCINCGIDLVSKVHELELTLNAELSPSKWFFDESGRCLTCSRFFGENGRDRKVIVYSNQKKFTDPLRDRNINQENNQMSNYDESCNRREYQSPKTTFIEKQERIRLLLKRIGLSKASELLFEVLEALKKFEPSNLEYQLLLKKVTEIEDAEMCGLAIEHRIY